MSFVDGAFLPVAVVSTLLGLAYAYKDDPLFESIKLTQKLHRVPGTIPFLGDTVTALIHRHDHHDMILDQFEKTNNEPFVLKFPFMECPMIFINNPKDGPMFHARVQDVLGEGIFNSDGEQWKAQRKTAANIFNVKNFKDFVNTVFTSEMETFSTILSEYATSGEQFNLQEILFKFTLDSFTKIGFGIDLESMQSKTPLPFALAFDSAQTRMLLRFFTPLWKLHESLSGIGNEHAANVRTIRDFGKSFISKRQQEGTIGVGDDLLSLLTKVTDHDGNQPSENLLIDYVLNFIIAGRDTTAQALSWAFFLLHQNPRTQDALLKEIKTVLGGMNPTYEQIKNEMPYANAVFHETLRLYPSVPVELKQANENDTLPDGTVVPKGVAVCWSNYCMGRTPRIWGADAKEFRPERWLEMEKQPSPFDYAVFNAGPRVCLGKSMAELEGVFVLVSVVQKFQIELMEPKDVTYAPSLTLPMAHGLQWVPVSQLVCHAPNIDIRINAFEADLFVSQLEPKFLSFESIATEQWYKNHETLELMNIQAHINVQMHCEEFITESFVTHSKIEYLITDLLTIDIWKTRVFPKVLDIAAGFNIKSYIILYHEATVVNLLELMFFNKNAVLQARDLLVDLADYCSRRIAFLAGWQPLQPVDHKTAMSEKQALARQHQELTFCISVTALSIFRYITDHCMDIPLAVLTRILNTNNAVGMLVELVERAPWIQTSKCSRGDTVYSIFADGAWRFVDADEMQRLGKVEAQVRIFFKGKMTEISKRRKFNYTDGKKATVLKLRPYIDETLVDQLPVLAHLQRYLDELLIMEISTWALDESFLVEEVAEVTEGISKNCNVPFLVLLFEKLISDESSGVSSKAIAK
ncbi:hypothetical protein HDU84_000152, partial [Entophlyctis sp. JEL0112]